MFSVGQEVTTKYGIGRVIGVGSCKPYVYVRLHSRPHRLYIINLNDLSEAKIKNIAPPSSEQIHEGGCIGAGTVSGEFGHHQGDAW